ncbi:MAG: hypothetical protein AAGC70_18085 [Pseudomonadota bacterium]
MNLSPPQVAGLLLIGLVMLIVGWLALGRQPRAIRLFALALCLVGLGYLATTPAPTSIVRTIFGEQY